MLIHGLSMAAGLSQNTVLSRVCREKEDQRLQAMPHTKNGILLNVDNRNPIVQPPTTASNM